MTPKLIAPTTSFGIALLRKELAANPGKNVLVSPLSVTLALGMTANGARGETLDAMNTTLGLTGVDADTNNLAYANLIASLKREGLGVQLEIANAIYARAGVSFHDAFLAANKASFGAAVDALDFDDPATIDVINAWVKANTGEKIDSIVKEIAANTIMFLLNAVYFKGEWTTKFDKALTANHPFTTADGGTKDHPLMYRNGDFAYVRSGFLGDFEAVSLPFGTSKSVRMVFLLPSDGKTVDHVVNNLADDKLNRLITMTYESEGELWLPRFEIDFDASLKDSLSALGMDQAFDSTRADFSGMRPGPVFIKDVKHKTFCKVTEDGAEAAAVTSVEMGLECVRMPFAMKVDRPFVTLIVDSENNTVLFAGVVNDPKNPE